MVHLLPFLLGS